MSDELKALSQRMKDGAGQCSKLSVDWDDNGFFYVGGLCVGGAFSGSEGDLIGEQLAAVQLITANVTALIRGYAGEIERLMRLNSNLTEVHNTLVITGARQLAEIASLRDQLAAWREAVMYRQPHGEDWLQQDIDWKYREQLKQCQEGKQP